MKNKQGFTLIEVLGVIVVVGLIAVITTPMIMGVKEKAEKATFRDSVLNSYGAVAYYLLKNNLEEIPKEGIGIKNLELKNKEQFKSGKVKQDAEKQITMEMVSNGVYCAQGVKTQLKVIKGDCSKLDDTPPIVDKTKVMITHTTNQIKVIIPVEAAYEGESEIKEYTYTIEQKEFNYKKTIKGKNNSVVFEGLKNEKRYVIIIEVENTNGLKSRMELEVSTDDIEIPRYQIDKSGWQREKTVTIIYPEMKEGYQYEYSIEGVIWKESVQNQQVIFEEDGYVIARISDGVNLVNANSYEVTKIDRIAPSITVNPATVSLIQGINYNLWTGVSYQDTLSGVKSKTATITSTTDLPVGNYTVTYTVTDQAGNLSTTNRILNILSKPVYTYDYTGYAKKFTAPYKGIYQIELWGAQGGNTTYPGLSGSGGKGAYVSGYLSLNAKEVLYIYVGSQGENGIASREATLISGGTNGGGNNSSLDAASSGGGGATDIRLANTVWTDFEGLKSRIMVAGGGGGAGILNMGSYGGANGILYADLYGYNGSQTSGGERGTGFTHDSGATKGGFGYGGNSGRFVTGAGGSGYYGGGGGNHMTPVTSGGGGGGSSFVSGCLGCNAIDITSTENNIIHTNQPNHYSGFIFTNIVMMGGNDNVPNYNGTDTMLGNSGNGYAKISLIAFS